MRPADDSPDSTRRSDPIYEYWGSPTSEKVRGYFERARTFEADTREDGRFIEQLLAPRYAGKTVLDIGAGPGRFVGSWAQHVSLTSVDWSESFLPVLRNESSRWGADVSRLDITRERLDRQFDLVFSTQVLLHIHPREVGEALDNARAMAKRDLVFITWQDTSQPFSGHDTDKIQSFNHDYQALFRAHGLELSFEMDLYITKRPGEVTRVTNKVYFLRVPRRPRREKARPPLISP